jgi:hypothetical protein
LLEAETKEEDQIKVMFFWKNIFLCFYDYLLTFADFNRDNKKIEIKVYNIYKLILPFFHHLQVIISNKENDDTGQKQLLSHSIA